MYWKSIKCIRFAQKSTICFAEEYQTVTVRITNDTPAIMDVQCDSDIGAKKGQRITARLTFKTKEESLFTAWTCSFNIPKLNISKRFVVYRLIAENKYLKSWYIRPEGTCYISTFDDREYCKS
ncbi:hypothetical protein SAY86_003596 [Trapa natans]|uniref:Uncharacterized protein n=1 Tax=Trapa natans TaxID=22666 RepID=A0AAN7RF15_TRANT|nr:hypothetical protein SAY86_003596 [Trapa natans]